MEGSIFFFKPKKNIPLTLPTTFPSITFSVEEPLFWATIGEAWDFLYEVFEALGRFSGLGGVVGSGGGGPPIRRGGEAGGGGGGGEGEVAYVKLGLLEVELEEDKRLIFTGFGGSGGNIMVSLLVVVAVVVGGAVVESLSDLLLNSLMFADTRPRAEEVGEDIFSPMTLYFQKEKKKEKSNI